MTNGSARFALYFAPAETTPLAALTSAWLGRDPASDSPRARPTLPWIGADEAEAITASPRRYGFHGTLKAPFALAAGCDEQSLTAAIEKFAQNRAPFRVSLKVGVLEGFLALRPAEPNPQLNDLADACVESFDSFRAPLSVDELARRRRAALTPRQDEHLVRWGYPYVFDTFRFHMTLTQRLDDDRRDAVLAGLSGMFADVLSEPVAFDSICLFAQPSHTASFRLIGRRAFGGAA